MNGLSLYFDLLLKTRSSLLKVKNHKLENLCYRSSFWIRHRLSKKSSELFIACI